MTKVFNANSLRHLLVVLLLVAGQSLAFAHGVDEASHTTKTVCDLCIAGQPLGAAAGGAATAAIVFPVSGLGLMPEFHPLAPRHAYLTPGPRAPPVSR